MDDSEEPGPHALIGFRPRFAEENKAAIKQIKTFIELSTGPSSSVVPTDHCGQEAFCLWVTSLLTMPISYIFRTLLSTVLADKEEVLNKRFPP